MVVSEILHTFWIDQKRDCKMGKKLTILFILGVVTGAVWAHPVVKDNVPAFVIFQVQSGNSWSSSSATLRGATSESMIRNELSRRYPNRKIRVLAVRTGVSQRFFVRYQVSKDRKNWSTSSATLYDARTESMAKNQISQRHPGMYVRILSKVKQ